MPIFLVHFIPAVIASIIIYKVAVKYSGKNPALDAAFRIVLLLVAFVAFRPFVLAFIMLNATVFSVYIICLVAYSLFQFKSVQGSLGDFAKAFIITFPIYMVVTILSFSTNTGKFCEKTEQVPGLIPIFSMCDKSHLESAKKYTKHIYHCRSAFYNSQRNIVYVTFGAESNPDRQTLLGIDPRTGVIKKDIPTYTVFRGYCPPGGDVCLHLIPPKKVIRFWDDEREDVVRTFNLGGDNRPRFFSPDVEKPIIYVATSGSRVEFADMTTNSLGKGIDMPTDSVLTVTNTRKKVVATVNHFLRPYLMIYDKESEKVDTMRIGISTLWKNWGHFFHLAADAENERVFVAASFECAIYEIDPISRKVVNRLPMPIGIRAMAFDTKRDLLLASNFVNGYVYVIDVSGEKLKVADKFFAGRRLRYFNYEADTDVFLLASANGFYFFEPALADMESFRGRAGEAAPEEKPPADESTVEPDEEKGIQ